jgi:tripartite-type tricarboxylate transporter receptor subunit TctC
MLSIYRLPQYAVSALLFLFAAAAPAPAQDCREKLATQLMEPVGSPPDALRARIDGEIARWAPVIKAANVKIN